MSGAAKGDITPHGPANWYTKFKSAVPGLVAAEGGGSTGNTWYDTWMFNSYQTFKTGTELSGLLAKYNQQKTDPKSWFNSWPGTQFQVPLVLTELGSTLSGTTEANYFDTVINQQATVAQKFLAGQQYSAGGVYKPVDNQHFQGYTILEFNDEPNKNGTTSAEGSLPDSEQVRGIFKYYPTNDQNQMDFRKRDIVKDKIDTTATYLPGQTTGDGIATMQYAVYKLYPIVVKGQSMLDALKKVFGIMS